MYEHLWQRVHPISVSFVQMRLVFPFSHWGAVGRASTSDIRGFRGTDLCPEILSAPEPRVVRASGCVLFRALH